VKLRIEANLKELGVIVTQGIMGAVIGSHRAGIRAGAKAAEKIAVKELVKATKLPRVEIAPPRSKDERSKPKGWVRPFLETRVRSLEKIVARIYAGGRGDKAIGIVKLVDPKTPIKQKGLTIKQRSRVKLKRRPLGYATDVAKAFVLHGGKVKRPVLFLRRGKGKMNIKAQRHVLPASFYDSLKTKMVAAALKRYDAAFQKTFGKHIAKKLKVKP
jgi:hypothetical protein